VAGPAGVVPLRSDHPVRRHSGRPACHRWGPLFTVAHLNAGFPTTTAAAIAAAGVGGLIVGRYPRHPIGWLFTVGASGLAAGLVADAYILSQVGGGLAQTWETRLAIKTSVLFGAPYTLALGALVFLLVPDGRLPSRRWRPALALPILGLVLHVATVVSLHPDRFSPGRVAGDYVGALTARLVVATTWAVLLSLPVAGWALVWRLRSSRGEQRQQLRWIAMSATLALLALARSWGGPVPWIATIPLLLAYLGVPVCTGVAILRYRLYDIDLIINRAVLLLAVAAFVTAAYVAVVVVIGAALGREAQGKFWPSLVALIVIALAFQPLRHRMLRWADRLVYGPRAEPYEALAEFSRQIGTAASPAELLPLFVQAAANRAGAFQARAHVDVPGTSGLSASWPDAADRPGELPSVELPITHRGERLGALVLTMPPGRPLRNDEQRLLERFAEQAGLGLSNVRLEAQLRARVAQAVAQSTALEASRRRLLGARDVERRRVAATLDRVVLAPLQSLVPQLNPDGISAEAAVSLLRRLDAATGDALNSLRQMTHGVFPTVLSRRGLVPAIRDELARIRAAGVLQVEPEVEESRFPAAIEVAGYFCCLGALSTVTAPLAVRMALANGLLLIDIAGTATGPVSWVPQTTVPSGADHPVPTATKWFVEPAALVDRVEAVGGSLRRDSRPWGGCVVHIELPVAKHLPA
jgi:signal transduction histidine kinase